MSYKDKLVDIYASHPWKKVGQVSAYTILAKQFDGNGAFHHFRDVIERCKIWIEENVLTQTSEKNQVYQALKLIRWVSERDPDVLKNCIKLLEETCLNGLPSELQIFFKSRCSLFEKIDHDYFLSFTQRSRSKTKGQPNRVNMRYKTFILSTLITIDFENFKLYSVTRNLLAETIHYLLREEGLKGFYFPDRESDTEDVDPKLDDALNSHLVFIQLVQNVMFDEPDKKKNYCYLEYHHVESSGFDKSRIKFVIEGSREKVAANDKATLDFPVWHKAIMGQDAVILEYPEKEGDVENIQALIETHLSSLIRKCIDGLMMYAP